MWNPRTAALPRPREEESVAGRGIDQVLYRGDTEMTNEHMKRCSALLVTGKCKLKPPLYTRRLKVKDKQYQIVLSM